MVDQSLICCVRQSSSSFNPSIDIAGKIWDYKTLWTLVAWLCSRRLGLGLKNVRPKRYVVARKPDWAAGNLIKLLRFSFLCMNIVVLRIWTGLTLFLSNRVKKVYNFFKALRVRLNVDILSYNINFQWVLDGFLLTGNQGFAYEFNLYLCLIGFISFKSWWVVIIYIYVGRTSSQRKISYMWNLFVQWKNK